MSDALDAAIRDEMTLHVCQRITVHHLDGADVTRCMYHDDWDVKRDECYAVGSAVRAGFEAGRRDALSEAAEALESKRVFVYERFLALDGYHSTRIHDEKSVAAQLRALLSTTEEAKP
ncbi:hypothetical protein [Cumulibacter soli]|uniref:hypothetical protein n=1 Tax=Cumulibacter soli TaxID=2546344 RepID=UPI001068AE5D|nr:hypothetical protein [Cumulibacter soli]